MKAGGATAARNQDTNRIIIITKKIEMFKRIFFFMLWLILQLQSCASRSIDIDIITNQYSVVDFSELKGTSIHFRSKGHQPNSSVYFISKFKGNCSPYVVEFNHVDKTVVEIRNHLVFSSCGEDYLSKDQIESLIKKYDEYKLCLLQVDHEGNVYINPDKQELPTLLRVASNAPPPDIEDFRYYKGNWYVRK